MGTFEERLIISPEIKDNIIYDEHMIRYELAKDFVKGKKVLDIACGSGYGSRLLAEAGAAEGIGIDIDKVSVAQAEAKYAQDLSNLQYAVGDAEKLEQADNYFDVVVSFETIEHLPNVDKYLEQLQLVVKDEGGLVFISTPNKDVYKEKNPYHLKEFTKAEFEEVIKKYFKYYQIFEQRNGLATYLNLGESETQVHFTTKSAPHYFLAVASQKPLVGNLVDKKIVSINEQALDNLYNNKGFRAANGVYRLLVKIPGMKRLLSGF